MDESASLKNTPLTSRHIHLHARMVPFAGYTMPLQYSGVTAEHQQVRNAAGLFDVCHMGEIRVTGARALPFVNYLITNDLERAATGQAIYTCACQEQGTILDDLIIYRFADDNVLIVCNASNRAKIWDHVSHRSQGWTGITLCDESDATALLALQGPRALEILALLEPGFEAHKLLPFRFIETKLLDLGVTVARTGYTGEDGVEIFAQADQVGRLWDALLEQGHPLGLVPAGLGCRDTLRLEARLSLYGQELNEQTTPLEAGLGWTVKLDKTDFLGKSALVAQQAEGLKRRIAGFTMLGRGSARPGYELVDSAGRRVGHCTSGGPSPTLGKAIGLGFLPIHLTEVGTEFSVDCRGKLVAARVVTTPFYRRAK
jgi:aminomethyltransferase